MTSLFMPIAIFVIGFGHIILGAVVWYLIGGRVSHLLAPPMSLSAEIVDLLWNKTRALGCLVGIPALLLGTLMYIGVRMKMGESALIFATPMATLSLWIIAIVPWQLLVMLLLFQQKMQLEKLKT